MKPNQLRSIRTELSLTQQAFADRLEVDRVTVARWEAGALPIDQRTAMAIEHLKWKPKRKSRRE